MLTTTSEPFFALEVAIFRMCHHQLYVYLQPMLNQPETVWSIVNGGIDLVHDKNIDNSVRRLIESAIGVESPYIEQVKTIGNATRHPQGWMVAAVYYGVISQSVNLPLDNWFAVNQLEKHDLAFDHLALIYSCLKRIKDKAQYTSVPLHMMPPEFTLTDLQHCFETILLSNIEKKSFRRRILDAGLIVPLDKERRGRSRPAQLYRVKRGHIIHHFSRKMHGKSKDFA